MITRNTNGILIGRSIVSVGKRHGGARNVFVPLDENANGTVNAPFGGVLQNPFPGAAKAYAGDLFEYRTDENGVNPKLYMLKTFEVVSVSGTTVNIVRDGYHHIPFVGDKLGVAPEKLGGAMTAQTVTKVVEATVDSQKVWALTLDKALTATAGAILVEADDDNTMMVKRINSLTPNDLDFVWSEASRTPADMDDDDYDSARYVIPVVFGGHMFISRMSPLPKCVLDVNPAQVNGWYTVGGNWGF